MNKNFTIVSLVLLVLIGAGIVYLVGKGIGTSNAPTATSTDTNIVVTAVPTQPSTPTSGTVQSSMPTVVTSSSIFPSDTTARVNGTVNPKGALTSYWYEYGRTSSLGAKTANQTIGSGVATIQAPGYITDLVKNTTYYARLVAENQNGRVAGTQYAFKTTEGNPLPVGSAPSVKTVSADTLSRTSARISGEVTPNQTETNYWFEYGKTEQFGNTSAFSSAGDGNVKVSVSVSLSDLEPLTTYYFRLNAQNQYGTINGLMLNFKTLGPTAATAPKVVSQSAQSIATSTATLRGTVNPNGAGTTYWFEYGTDSLFGAILTTTTDKITIAASGNSSSVATSVSGLNTKTNYYFRLVAQNSIGTVRGDNVTFKTK